MWTPLWAACFTRLSSLAEAWERNLDQLMKTEDPLSLPFPRSYWVAPGQFLAGCYPGDRESPVACLKLQGLLAAGVTRIISLMEASEVGHGGVPFADYRAEFECLAATTGRRVACDRFEITDMGIPAVATMSTILNAIDGEHAEGGCVYVHCWGGKGRTGTVVGCWLMRHGRATADTVLQQLVHLTAHNRVAFPEIPQTDQQCHFVRSWTCGT